jgi:hypothetical protein
MESLSLIENYIDVLLSSNTHCLVIKGPSGISKTTTVLNKLSSIGLSEGDHYLYVTGYITPLKLFETLAKSRMLDEPRVMIFDDVDSIFTNKTSVALLKSALAEARGKRVVSYESSSRNGQARSFEFTGKVILIVNGFVKNNTIQPLLDRGIFYEIEPDVQELGIYIESNMASMYDRFSDDERSSVWNKVKRFLDNPNFSLRSLNRAFNFYRHNPENWYALWIKTIKSK